MSQNHHHEPQDARIERLLRDRQPTGNKLLDDLAGTTPRANPAFQQQLEVRLLDTLRHHEQRRRGFMIADRTADGMKPRWMAVPLTLVAAMIAVVIAGGILLTMNRTDPNLGVAAQPEASATMTASLTTTASRVPMVSPTFTATPIGNVPFPANATAVPATLPGIIVPGQGTQATIYAGPGENYAVIDRLEAGTQVSVVGRTESSAWLRIQTLSGRDGWISSNEVELPSVPVIDLAVSATPIPTALLPTVLPARDMLSVPIPVDGRIVGEARVYASLDISAPIIAQVSPETPVLVVGAAGGSDQERALFQIRLDDGMEGWVDAHLVQILLPPTPVVMAVEVTPTLAPNPANTLSLSSAVTPYIGVVSVQGGPQANVRAAPSFDADVVERLADGSLVEVMVQNGDWLRVRTEGGNEGWIAASLVQPSNTINMLEPTPVSATVLPMTIEPATAAVYAVIMPITGDSVTVFQQPEDYEGFVGVLSTGTIVRVIGQRPDGQWLQVQQYSDGDGIEGWVIAEAVDFQAAPVFSLATPEIAAAQVAPIAMADYQPVVIALRDMPRGTQINSREDFAVVYWPAEILPDGIFTDPASLVGLFTVQDVARWQPVLASALSENTPNPSSGRELPTGKVAVAVPLDLIESVVTPIREGDRVDVIATLLFVDISGDNPLNLPTVEPGEARPVTERIVSNAEVVYVRPSGMEIVTLAVSPQEAEVLTWAIDASVTLRLELSEED
jgi:Flp pilus assembly protein CpaB